MGRESQCFAQFARRGFGAFAAWSGGGAVALALSAAPALVAAPASAAAAASADGLGSPPCPEIEVACGQAEGGSAGPGESSACSCGPGSWTRIERRPILVPTQATNDEGQHAVNGTRWRYCRRSVALPGSVHVSASVDGASQFWAQGAFTASSRALFFTSWREEWRGTLPACARPVSLEALGGGTMTIGVAASPRVGCAASAVSSGSGSTSGPGSLLFTLSPVNLDGRVQYDSSSRRFEISGTLGGEVELVRPNVRGTISSRDEWSTEGQGTATGAASFTITPGRRYCAFTNRAVQLSVQGAASVSVAAAVGDNGMSSASASADLSIDGG